MTKVVLLQSNYLPWKGYFDLIHDADICVFYDCVQYTKGDWRNRNQFYLGGQKRWLTVPVEDAPLDTPIHDVRIHEAQPWRRRHARSLLAAYEGSPHVGEVWGRVGPWIEAGPGGTGFGNLSALNQGLLRTICRYLGITTRIIDSRELSLVGKGTDRILDALKKTGGDHYISGPAAKAYLEEDKLKAAGISLAYKDYSGYPAYPQFSPRFDERVSILDLLCQQGPRSPEYIWGWRE